MPKTKLSMKKRDVENRQRQITELLNAGLSDYEIAAQLDYADRSAVAHARKAMLERYMTFGVEELRATENARLDAMQSAVWSKARRGDEKAIGTVLKIQERRAKYWPGLEAPAEVKHSGEMKTTGTDELARLLTETLPGLYEQWSGKKTDE